MADLGVYQHSLQPFSAITDSCSEYNEGEKSNDPPQYKKGISAGPSLTWINFNSNMEK